MTDSGLSPQQLQVIDALSSGANLTDAAAEAGVHRNTIAYWRRNFPRFHRALAHAHYDRALMYREQAEALAGLAFEALREILTDPKASPSVRLKAAMFIIEKATTPPPSKPDKPLTFNDLFTAPIPESEVSAAGEQDSGIEDGEPQRVEPAAQKCTTVNNAQPRYATHNDAQTQQPYRRTEPKAGRNKAAPAAAAKNTSAAA
ncbi:MAG: helix-turn-helix domain-containing protein [Bryobacteraceae bacterium]|jgi:transposase-like protein